MNISYIMVKTAHGKELDKLGKQLGVKRKRKQFIKEADLEFESRVMKALQSQCNHEETFLSTWSDRVTCTQCQKWLSAKPEKVDTLQEV